MKKHVFGVFVACLLMACGASKTVRTSKKVIKGNWVLTDVKSSVVGELKITLLSDADRDCFENSTWQFIPNNNTGFYTLSGLSCDVTPRYFVFTIDEVNETTGFYDFLLKPTNKKGKSVTNRGSRFNLTQHTETTMQWEQTVRFEGKPSTLTMNFIKQ